MTVQIALLRAVNLPSHGKVAMAELRDLVEGLGFTDVRTILQSGNVVFRSGGSGAELEKQLEAAASKDLGLKTEFMVRTAAQWNAIVKGNPFPAEAKKDPGHLVVMVCKDAPGKDVKVTGARREVVRVKGKEIYIVYPDGIGRSRLKVGTVGTGRNWNTVLKLQELAKA
jgi:uncharacterized protein (DUF1697 family)